MTETALVLTDDEWSLLASICERWLNGDTNRYSIDDKCEALARRIMTAEVEQF
jgi:hypothetical protein